MTVARLGIFLALVLCLGLALGFFAGAVTATVLSHVVMEGWL